MKSRARRTARPFRSALRILTFTLASVFLLACSGTNAADAKASAPSVDFDAARVPDAPLVFRRDGKDIKRLSLRQIAQHGKVETVETDDPYYLRHKRFRALSLAPALVYAFGVDVAQLRRAFFVLKATDGYAVPVEGARLLEPGAYIAFDDLDVPGFEPIGPQKVSPSPAYLVWTGPGQANLDTHPRPWQLAAIEVASFETLYPHTVPTGEPADGVAMHGFSVFRDHCIKCHAINREGGRVGPDLNVRQSIVEYRSEAQIRAYIQDPSTFRYGAMPAHPSLTSRDLDGLLAYFRAMSTQKHDPDAKVAP